MGNTLRCCLACVLPCGALDLIRIVHLNGYVEEITRPVRAGEILQANPNHILSKPCSSDQGLVRKILIVSPDSQLKRGSIYFLVPQSSLPTDRRNSKKKQAPRNKPKKSQVDDDDDGDQLSHDDDHDHHLTYCDKYLDDHNVMIAETKKNSSGRNQHHRRRHSRSRSATLWHPHLASISEEYS